MSSLAVDVEFHQVLLERICGNLRSHKKHGGIIHCNVVGLRGIGKSQFLRHIELRIQKDKDIKIEKVDIRSSISESTSGKQDILELLEERLKNDAIRTVILFDHMEEATIRPDLYDAEFFEDLARYGNYPNITYVFASTEPIGDLLKKQEKVRVSRDWYTIDKFFSTDVKLGGRYELGLVKGEEADEFIRNAIEQLKERVDWLGENVEYVRRVAGRYPFFLSQAVQMLRTVKPPESFEESFRNSEAVRTQYKQIWEFLEYGERKALYQIAKGRGFEVHMKGHIRSFVAKALLTEDRNVFSPAFHSFVNGHREFAWYFQVGYELWPLNWNRRRVLNAMLILLLAYTSAMITTRFLIEMGPEVQAETITIVALLVVFVILFVLLGFLYVTRKQ